MAKYIFINGVRLDPKEAASRLLPLDTVLVCPGCGGNKVGAGEPKASHLYRGEVHQDVPRQQDRWCLDCKHQWCSILPPLAFQIHSLY